MQHFVMSFEFLNFEFKILKQKLVRFLSGTGSYVIVDDVTFVYLIYNAVNYVLHFQTILHS